MINIKSSLFYAAMAACLGTGYGASYLVSQGNNDPARVFVPRVECEETEADKQFRSTRPLNSKGQGF